MSAVQNQVAALHARYLELAAQPRSLSRPPFDRAVYDGRTRQAQYRA